MPKNSDKADLSPPLVARHVYSKEHDAIRVHIVASELAPVARTSFKEKVLTWLAYVLAFALIAKYCR